MNVLKKTRRGHKETVLALNINVDNVLSSVAEDGRCLLWSFDDQIIHDIDVNKEHISTSDGYFPNTVVFDPSDAKKFYISVGTHILAYDMRNCSSSTSKFDFNVDEINQLCVNDTGRYLAACDDEGEIKVIDIQESRLLKTLARRHSNICSSVQFRPKKSWQVLSAGFDCNIINWDFSSGKPQKIFNMNDYIMKDSEGSEKMFVNPPFVHALSIEKYGKKFATGLGNGEIGFFQFQGKSFECSERIKGHESEVSQVCYLNGSDCSLVSGGNDGKINIWKDNQTENDIKHKLYHQINHGSKINWITCSSPTNTSCIFVADQSSNVTVYELQ